MNAEAEVPETKARLLVVGGSGFLGWHVVRRGVAAGWDVTSISLRPERRTACQGVRSIACDIADKAALHACLRGCAFDYVVNCAGYVDHTPFGQGGRRVFDVHFGGVANLVEVLDRGVLRRFVNIGSSDEYGGAPAPQCETQRELPIAPYSLGKVAATQLLQMLWRTEQFPAVPLRLFLIYGPGQGRERFLPQVIAACLRGESFPVSAGRQLRDFCHVDDVIRGVFTALTEPAARGEVINVASGQPVAVRAVVESICGIARAGEPRFGEIPYRAGENMELYANIAKARSVLNWEPEIGLAAGLHEVVARMKESL